MTRVHWTVKSNYPLRVGSFLNMFIAVVFHGWGQGYSPVLSTLIVLHLLVYPHVAFWVARHAAESKRAEIRNLSIDCLLFGVLMAALGFPLWITSTVYIASTLNLVINHGYWGCLRSQLAFFGGCLIGIAVWGWRFAPDTAWPATAMCLFGNAVYMMAIGIASHKRNLRLREVREALRQRTLELSHTLAQLQKSQADLLEAEKLASLGSLVAGVAHELNTPIGNALVTATTLDDESRSMAEQMAAGTMKRSGLQTFLSRSSEMSDLIVRSCQRAAKLIVSFKKVAVDQTSEQQRHFHLREVVEDHLVTVGPSLTNAKIEIINCVPDFITCNSYPGALGQVVSSVVQNAVFHAFGPDDAGSIVIEAHADTRQATLIVRDNGKGMSAEVVKHVFEPFFTTRLGQGESGLGLTICRNITTGVLGGNMRVVSVPDQGSSFLIEFPLQAPHRAVAQAAASG